MARVLVLSHPRWPVAGLGHRDDEPVAVLERGRVVSCSTAAADAGVCRAQLKREAQRCHPSLVVVERDKAAEARAFEPVVAAVAELSPLVEVTEPGMLALDVRGPARYFGGEAALADLVLAKADGALPEGFHGSLRLGVADGRLAAVLAGGFGAVVGPGESAAFLSGLPVDVLGEPDLADLLVRLGIRTLGAFAALPAASVVRRFGQAGELAQLRARGVEDERLAVEAPVEPLAVQAELDPPADRIDTASFVARGLAEELVTLFEARFLSCTVLVIEAETEHGEALSRRWRSEEPYSASTIVERVRWQLDGWLSGSAPEPVPTAGITLLRLVADEVAPARGRQLVLWGGRSDAEERARRGLDRIRGVYGPGAIFTARVQGGREPADRIVLVAWGEPSPELSAGPWPGRDPLPVPMVVLHEPVVAEVVDGGGEPVRVFARGRLSGEPARLRMTGGQWAELIGWAGPWLLDERSWDAMNRRRRARFQLLTAGQDAYLAYVEADGWFIEAAYD